MKAESIASLLCLIIAAVTVSSSPSAMNGPRCSHQTHTPVSKGIPTQRPPLQQPPTQKVRKCVVKPAAPVFKPIVKLSTGNNQPIQNAIDKIVDVIQKAIVVPKLAPPKPKISTPSVPNRPALVTRPVVTQPRPVVVTRPPVPVTRPSTPQPVVPRPIQITVPQYLRPASGSFEDLILMAHNVARAAERAGLVPLVWDKKLEQDARSWSEQQAFVYNDMRHSSNTGGEGENLYWCRGCTNNAELGRKAGVAWANEKVLWIADGSPAIGQGNDFHLWGHWTQMVWRSTTRVGCAKVQSNSGVYITCRYLKQGNVGGQKPY